MLPENLEVILDQSYFYFLKCFLVFFALEVFLWKHKTDYLWRNAKIALLVAALRQWVNSLFIALLLMIEFKICKLFHEHSEQGLKFRKSYGAHDMLFGFPVLQRTIFNRQKDRIPKYLCFLKDSGDRIE